MLDQSTDAEKRRGSNFAPIFDDDFGDRLASSTADLLGQRTALIVGKGGSEHNLELVRRMK